MERAHRAIVVEADPIYREGLVHVLGIAGYQQVLQFESLDHLQSAIDTSPDDLLLLVSPEQAAPNVSVGIEALRHRLSGAKLVILIEKGNDRGLVEAVNAGADGVLVKPLGRDALIKSLELVMLGEKIVPAECVRVFSYEPTAAHTGAADQSRIFEKLSAREMDVLMELSQGSPNKVIARRFGITEATVKVHVKSILRKISARNRTEAAIWACNFGPYAGSSKATVADPAQTNPGRH